MINFAEILKANPTGVLATVNGDKVRTRVFQCQFSDGNKLYFCTSSEKPAYAQMIKNQNVSFCTYTQDFAPVLSVDGEAIFVEDLALKQKLLDGNALIKSIYKSQDNPHFKVFYIDVKEIETFSFEEGTKSYTI